RLLEESGGGVKTAILLAAGAANADAAEKILEKTGQKLRPALSAIEGSKAR
ncbi:MAG: N-acetylmuramic acid 6-phosphate etherase, partial [Mesorhizobium sp.]